MRNNVSLATIAAAVLFPLVAASGLEKEPRAIEILTKVDRATKAVEAVAYKAKLTMEGEGASRFPGVEGTVRAQAIPGKSLAKMNIEGAMGDRPFHVITDGETVLSLDRQSKVATRGKVPAASRLLARGTYLWMQEFLHPKPFGDELNGDAAKHEGTKEIGGVECDVIYVVYAQNQGRSRWYFGRKDHLPRRVDRIFRDGQTTRVLTVLSLEASPKFDDKTFATTAPEGFEVREFKGPPPRPELLAVGSEAPGWNLKTPKGSEVSLASLRGKVVVLDFWATWCGPCRRAMPGIQEVHEKFQGKPVAIIGLNCWERAGAKTTPAKFMKDNGYTYGLLLNGDEVAKAYNVSGIPTFYVIGPDGKIVHRAVGANPALEEQLVGIIEAALPKRKRMRL